MHKYRYRLNKNYKYDEEHEVLHMYFGRSYKEIYCESEAEEILPNVYVFTKYNNNNIPLYTTKVEIFSFIRDFESIEKDIDKKLPLLYDWVKKAYTDNLKAKLKKAGSTMNTKDMNSNNENENLIADNRWHLYNTKTLGLYNDYIEICYCDNPNTKKLELSDGGILNDGLNLHDIDPSTSNKYTDALTKDGWKLDTDTSEFIIYINYTDIQDKWKQIHKAINAIIKVHTMLMNYDSKSSKASKGNKTHK